MGLIQAFKSALSSELADQYLEYFYCDSLSDDILVTKGTKKNTKHSTNNATDNVINNGSGIVINEGQCALIVSEGAVVEVCAEPGVFTYNSSTESSVFCGQLGKGLIESFKQFGKRIAYGGEIPTDQRVYYVNVKEIMNNKFGTQNPIPFRVIDARVGADLELHIRCHGSYTMKIQDPILFYRSVSGNITGSYSKSRLSDQLREELLNGLIPALSAVSAKGVRYSEIGLHSEDVRQAIMESLETTWVKNRGLMLTSLSFGSIDIPSEELTILKDAQERAIYTNPSMMAATLGLAQAEAMKAAASNESTGPMMAFAGMNMANMMGANTGFGAMMANGQGIAPVTPGSANIPPVGQPAPSAAQPVNENPLANDDAEDNVNVWACTCGHSNTGKFCAECGSKKPEAAPMVGWECPDCKTQNKGKFCMECGAKKPEAAFIYKCDKCGWEPKDPKNPPKFCPECGDPFNDDDKTNA